MKSDDDDPRNKPDERDKGRRESDTRLPGEPTTEAPPPRKNGYDKDNEEEEYKEEDEDNNDD